MRIKVRFRVKVWGKVRVRVRVGFGVGFRFGFDFFGAYYHSNAPLFNLSGFVFSGLTILSKERVKSWTRSACREEVANASVSR